MSVFTIQEVSTRLGLEEGSIRRYVELEWIQPARAEGPLLDETDIARVNLIMDLMDRMGVNDDSVPIILHLIDQVNLLRRQIRRAESEAGRPGPPDSI